MGIIHLVSSVDDRKVSERASLSPSILVRLWHYKAGGWGRTGYAWVGVVGGGVEGGNGVCVRWISGPDSGQWERVFESRL